MARIRFLKRDVLTPQLLSKLNRLNAIAAARNQSLSEMALSWLLKDGLVTSVLMGASSPAQLLTNIGAVRNTDFTADELYEIDSIINK
jgi:L-glyceraldehyde 3-phosphate reductase